MYEIFFELQSRPFLPAPHTARYYPAEVIENARRTLGRCIDRGEGAGLIVGPPGTGKSLLCQVLADDYTDRFAVALLRSGRLGTRPALLQAILYELKLPYRGMDEGELRLMLVDHLEPTAESHEGLLLLIDEAHTLPSRLLEEVRMLTNFVRNGQPRVRVVLAGSPVLEERFASPKLTSFSQRLAVRCYLESLDAGETAAYVRAQLASVGGNPTQVFDDGALRSIYRATDGIPRLINQLCDHALILASLGGVERLTSEAIEEAWADLQQLPAPWNGSTDKTQSSLIVEFGALDDVREELPEAIPFRSAQTSTQLHVSEPDEQLDMIEEHLSTLEAAFQPAGSIGSAIELDFPEFGDPFGEHFAEEEIVLDRYASGSEIFADVPRVSSWEGRELSAMLAPLDQAAPCIKPLSSFMATTGCVPDFDIQLHAEPIAGPVISLSGISLSGGPQEFRGDAGVIHADAFWGACEQVSNSRDLIILEDEPKRSTPSPAPVAPVRKREYRQLFAKLRRG